MTEAAFQQPIAMQPPDFSPDATQRAASDPNVSAWVNASAGTGKTKVLTDRVTRLLLDGVRPERILCLTYTRAAAAEMSLRVADRLSGWATCSDNDLSANIADLQGAPPTSRQTKEARLLFARVLACPGGMRIRTIHAFCQEILRRFPIEAGLAPHFSVIEENDARTMLEEAQRDILRLAADPKSALGRALQSLAGNLGEHNFTAAMRSMLGERARLQASIAKAGGLDRLIARMRSELSLSADDTAEHIIRAAVAEGAFNRSHLLAAGEALGQGLKTCQELGRVVLKFLALPPDERAANYQEYSDAFFTEKGELLKKYTDKKASVALADSEEILVQEATRLHLVQERLEAAELAETTASLLCLGIEMTGAYEKRKSLQAALDYDDLIIRTDELLRRPGIAPWVLYKLDGGIDHILVDEAQDTSRAQWNIVASLADEFFAGSSAKEDVNRTLFVVGDEKQSIFSFQRADPEAFADRRAYFAEKILEAGKQYRETPMRVSFRSAPAVLQAVDQVFAADRARYGVSHEPVSHRAINDKKPGRVEVWPLLPAPPKEEESDGAWALPLGYEEEHDREARLAAQIADKIGGWLAKKEILPGSESPVVAGDIMILLRRRGRFADLMVRALKKRGVPVTGVDRMCLVQQLPVMDLLALVQFSLLPEDDLNLASLLKGPLLGLGEDQLMELAIGRKGSLWSSLSDKASGNAAFTNARDYLSRWLNAADFMAPFAFLADVLSEPCPASKISGLHAIWSRLGPDALDPVDELLNAAQDFSRRHAPSLQSFLQWLTASEAEIKRELDRGGNLRDGGQVRIMTVHASKGLEAPIVFLPDTSSLPRSNDVAKILWDEQGVPFYTSRKPRGGVVRRLWDVARDKQMQEYRRLLYVALTRAANHLYIGGWEASRSNGDPAESWYRLAADALKPLHQASEAEAREPAPDIAFADPVLHQAKKRKAVVVPVAPDAPLPEWARVNAPQENALASVAPSLFALAPAAATPDRVFARGRIIHRLLQSLPDINDAKRDAVAAKFLANPEHQLSPEQQKEIAGEVLGLLRDPAYAALFGPGSRAEVPLAGSIGGQKVTGQVDRLRVGEDAIWIVDYKTNRPPPQKAADVPEAYRLQLAAYRAILADIYPGRAIRCFLLWTYKPLLMEL